MAFLDELKKEALALKEHEQSLTQARMMEVTQSFLLVQSKLKGMLHYLQELTKTLNNLAAQSSPRTYYIDGFGNVEDFHPEKYVVNTERMTIDQKEFINVIYLRYSCKTATDIVIEKNTPSMIEMQREYLWKANIKFQCTDFKNEKGFVDRARFTVANEIPVHIKFTADFEKAKVFLSMKNFNGLTVNEFTYDADEIDEPMLDEFARFLVGKPSSFMELGRHQQAMRQKVTAKRASTEVEYANHNARSEAKQEKSAKETVKEGKKGLFSSIKSLISKG